jgi:hypothetical protein
MATQTVQFRGRNPAVQLPDLFRNLFVASARSEYFAVYQHPARIATTGLKFPCHIMPSLANFAQRECRRRRTPAQGQPYQRRPGNAEVGLRPRLVPISGKTIVLKAFGQTGHFPVI